jgi:peptidoglycan-N-acetylglucosamine deacetylase
MRIFKNRWLKRTVIGGFAFLIFPIGLSMSNFLADAAPNEQTDKQYNRMTEPLKLFADERPFSQPAGQPIVNFSEEKKLMTQDRKSKEISQKQQNDAITNLIDSEKEGQTVPADSPIQANNSIPANNPVPVERSVPTDNPFQAESQVPVISRTVYLTFDDGPQAFSGEILSLLEQFHAKATFFMLDGNIKKYPDAVRLMISSGQSVGLHGVTHNAKQFYESSASVLSEMNQDRETLQSITGADSNLIRTPYGSKPGMTPEYRKAVLDNGYQMWDWNIDSKDWFYKDERYVHSVIEQLEKKKDGTEPLVILLHERSETLAQLPKLLEYLIAQKYDCQPLNNTMQPLAFK